MFNVSIKINSGRCIVWHGDADSPAQAVEMALAQAALDGTEAVDIRCNEEPQERKNQ